MRIIRLGYGTVFSSNLLRALLLVTLTLVGSESLGADAVDIAVGQINRPYVWGGNGPDQFDCSGLTRYAFQQVGTQLPRTAVNQSQTGVPVVGALQRGDLLFFATDDSRPGTVTHVGVYEGLNIMIDANSYAGEVTRDDITTPYWSNRFLSARRPGGFTSANRIYVAVPTESRIAVVDANSDQVIDSIALPSQPQGIAASADGTFLLAVLSNISKLARVRLSDKTVTQMDIPPGAGAVAILPSGQKAYVAHSAVSGTSVSVINLANNTVAKSIPLAGSGTFAANINVTPSGTKAYVTFGGINNAVSVLDTVLDQVLINIDAQTTYHDEVAFNASSTVAVASARGSNCPTNGGFSKIDAVNDTTLAAVSLTSGKIGVKVSADGSKAYLPDTCGTGNLLVFNLGTNTQLDSIPTGLTIEPSAVAVFESLGRAFVIDETGTMSDVNLTTRSHTTFPLSTTPFGGVVPWTVTTGPTPP